MHDSDRSPGVKHDFKLRYAFIPVDEVQGRVIRNPAYGGPGMGMFGWSINPCFRPWTKPQFRVALEESIREEGFRNPIIAWTFPKGLFISFGSSRLLVARDMGIKLIPAIVIDYDKRYEDMPEVTMENYHEFFTDVPPVFEITEQGLDSHYNLERKRYQNYDGQGLKWAEGAEWIDTEFPWLKESDD